MSVPKTGRRPAACPPTKPSPAGSDATARGPRTVTNRPRPPPPRGEGIKVRGPAQLTPYDLLQREHEGDRLAGGEILHGPDPHDPVQKRGEPAGGHGAEELVEERGQRLPPAPVMTPTRSRWAWAGPRSCRPPWRAPRGRACRCTSARSPCPSPPSGSWGRRRTGGSSCGSC